MKHFFLLLMGLAGALTALGQPATPAPPTFTWATASGVINQLPGGVSGAAAHALATVAANGELWLNLPDSVATLYSGIGMGRQRLERRRPDGSLALRRYLIGTSHLTQLRAAPNGRLYLLGYFLGSVTLDATHTLSISGNLPHDFIACLDAGGAVLYARDLSQANNTAYCAPQTLVPGPADHVYLALSRSIGGAALVQHLDAQGALVGTITQTGGGYISGIELDAQGTLFVTGTCVRTAGGLFNGTPVVPGVSGNGYNQYLACYEPSGSLRWVRFMGDFTCVDPQVRTDRAGGVYWLTTLYGAATLGGFSVPGPSNGGTDDYLLARLNGAGVVQWLHDVATTQAADAGMGHFFCLDTDAAGNAYLAGQTKGSIQWAPGVQTVAGTTKDLLVQRISPLGGVDWARTAGCSQGGVQAGTLALAPDGSVVVTGIGVGVTTLDGLPLPTVSRSHHFVARLTPAAPTATGLAAAGRWQLSPNPASNRVVLHAPAGAGPVQAVLLDALGRQVATAEGTSPNFDIQAYPAGLYFVRATSAAGTWVGRAVKE